MRNEEGDIRESVARLNQTRNARRAWGAVKLPAIARRPRALYHRPLRDIRRERRRHDRVERAPRHVQLRAARRLLTLVAAVDDPRLEPLAQHVTADVIAAV